MLFGYKSAIALTGLCILHMCIVRAGAQLRQSESCDPQFENCAEITILARQQTRIDNLEAELQKVTGASERLAYQLRQSNRQIDRLEAQLSRFEERLHELEQARNVSESDKNQVSVPDSILVENPSDAAVNLSNQDVGEDVASTDLVPARSQTEADSNIPLPDTGSLGTISASDLPGEAGPLFAEARARLLRFDYVGAERAFAAFIEQFSDDLQAAEAYFWLGEALYIQEAYAEAASAYTQLLKAYGDDKRAPSALVKLARTMRMLNDTNRACIALEQLPIRYPDMSVVTQNLASIELRRSGCDIIEDAVVQ